MTALADARAEVVSRAERALLGAALVHPAAASTVAAELQDDDFGNPQHAAVWRAVHTVLARGGDVGTLTVHAELVAGGATPDGVWLVELAEAAPVVPTQISGPLQVVREEAARRRLIMAGTRMLQVAETSDFDSQYAVAKAQADLDVVQRVGSDGPVLASELIPAVLERYDDGTDDPEQTATFQAGLSTGYRDLDQLLHKLRPGQLIVAGGRPGAGKSVFGLGVAAHVAFTLQKPSLFFTLEMSRTEVVERLIAMQARVSLHLLQTGKLDDQAWSRISRALPALSSAPLWIDDTPDLTLAQLRARARQSRQRHGATLVVVDYLQLLTPTKRAENRQAEVAEMSRGLKLAAKQLEVPFLVLAQLNRAVEQRQKKRPVLSDLRESGAVEQDSDVVVLIHRDPQAPAGTPEAEEAELIVAKQRNGPTGDVRVGWQGYYSRFVDMPTASSPGVVTPSSSDEPDPDLWTREPPEDLP